MGLRDWLKFRGALYGAKMAGKEAFSVEKVRAFVNLYGKTISGIVIGLCSWAFAQNCAPVLGVEVLSSLHLSCDAVQHILMVLSAFLVGAGVSEPDQWLKDYRAKGANRRADDPKD